MLISLKGAGSRRKYSGHHRPRHHSSKGDHRVHRVSHRRYQDLDRPRVSSLVLVGVGFMVLRGLDRSKQPTEYSS